MYYILNSPSPTAVFTVTADGTPRTIGSAYRLLEGEKSKAGRRFHLFGEHPYASGFAREIILVKPDGTVKLSKHGIFGASIASVSEREARSTARNVRKHLDEMEDIESGEPESGNW
ncbi:MAG: hypothetical protein AABY01_03240 [Nanoarchaeota archaeon]